MMSLDLDTRIKLTLQQLIVLEIHCADVVRRLIEEKVTSHEQFGWLCHLRYSLDGENFTTEMINTSISYGYEYLGNSKRLVITPLTERCFRTIFCALRSHLGCSIEVSERNCENIELPFFILKPKRVCFHLKGHHRRRKDRNC